MPSFDSQLLNNTPNPWKLLPGFEFLQEVPRKASSQLTDTLMGIGFETLDRDTFNPQDVMKLVGESGVKMARCQSGWWKCERTPGVYDFSWLDEVVDGLSKYGVRTWLSLSFGHPAYTPCPAFDEAFAEAAARGEKPRSGFIRGYVGECPIYHGEKGMTGWRNYVRALAQHFKGRVHEWEIWNENDSFDTFWRHKGKVVYEGLGIEEMTAKCAADYVEFLRITGDLVREVIPDARIVAVVSNPATEYVRQLGLNHLADYADVFSYHFYSIITNDFYQDQYIQFARACLGPNIEFWMGESGHATGKSKITNVRPSQYAQAKFIARNAMHDLKNGSRLSSVFTVIDFNAYYEDGSDQFYGVINGRTLQPKLGYYTIQALAWLTDRTRPANDICAFLSPLDGSTVASRSKWNVTVAAFRKDGIPAVAVWQSDHVSLDLEPVIGELRVLHGPSGELQNPIVIDPIRGTVHKLSNARHDDSLPGKGACAVTIPVPDYPVIVTDQAYINN
ncbi:MAG: beta-galactosidase [Victivallales bacterium]|nr:beta-galactosidase [Victivallales bacterium]